MAGAKIWNANTLLYIHYHADRITRTRRDAPRMHRMQRIRLAHDLYLCLNLVNDRLVDTKHVLPIMEAGAVSL